MGWIGVDLDKTIAHYDKWVSETHIGEPIQPMVDRVKRLIEKGWEIRVFTARMSDRHKDAHKAIQAAIAEWTLKHVGKALRATCEKDYAMIYLYDDRAVTIEGNTGRLLSPDPMTKESHEDRVILSNNGGSLVDQLKSINEYSGVLHLSKYERDNLFWALNRIMLEVGCSDLNTGDWVGQLRFKLEALPAGSGPNRQ